MTTDFGLDMELHCDCRTAGAQSIMITAKEMGARIKVLHIDIVSLEGFSGDYEQCALYNKPYFIDTSVKPPVRFREWRAICVYLVFRQGGQVIPRQSNKAAYLSREQWEFFEADIFTSRWYFMECYLPRVTYLMNRHIAFTRSAYFLDLEAILNNMEAMLFTPFMGGEVFTLLDIYLMPWMFRLLSKHRDSVFKRRPKLAVWWCRVQKRRVFGDFQNWMKKSWTEGEGVIFNDGVEKFDWPIKEEKHACFKDKDNALNVCNWSSGVTHSTAD